MDSVFVKLVDRKGHVLWVGGYDHLNWKEPLCDYVDEPHKARVEGMFADVVIRGQTVEFFAQWSCPMVKLNGIWVFTRILPVENVERIHAIAAVVMQQVLPDNFDDFTDTDKQLLTMLAEDHSVRQIAEKFGRSESAIDLRIRTLKDKLNVNTLHGMVASGLRGHLIKMPKLPSPLDPTHL